MLPLILGNLHIPLFICKGGEGSVSRGSVEHFGCQDAERFCEVNVGQSRP